MKPLTAKWFSLLVFFIFLAMGVVVATQIHNRTLEQVLQPNSLVIEAKLLKTSSQRSQLWKTYEFELAEAHFLSGREQKVQSATLSTGMPHRRTVKGVERRVSPLRDTSGLEGELVVGERYLFIAQVAPKDGLLEAVRVEPVERTETVLQILRTKRGCFREDV